MTTKETQIRILVVDDEEIVHASFRKLLSRFDYQIEGVTSAEHALERLSRERYEVVVTDLMMPEINGIQLLRELQLRGLHTPVIMITGYPTISTAIEAMRLGAIDYVTKPFTRRELLNPIRRALRQEEAGGGAAGDRPCADDPVADPRALLPGAEVVLPHHAWARLEQGGTFLVGVEGSFLRAAGTLVALTVEGVDGMVEQGHVGLRLTNDQGEEHGVAMPLSGQVIELGAALQQDPKQLTADTWLLRVLPSHLETELPYLVLRSSRPCV